MMLPPLAQRDLIRERLHVIFPEGTPNRAASVRDIAVRTVFVMLYANAVEGSEVWLRPDQVTRMTDKQAAKTSDGDRAAWAKSSAAPSKAEIPGRWYAANTRESVRDDTIRNALIPNSAIVERPGLPTASPAGRYALRTDFAALFDPRLNGAVFGAAVTAWQAAHLTAGARMRIAVMRKGAATGRGRILVTFPNGETRLMAPGPSSDLSRNVIEVFAPRFLGTPAVIFLSESGDRVVARDDELARKVGINIPADKNLPDIILADLAPAHPLLVFVEVVATDGPISESRKAALLGLTDAAGFARENIAFLTAYLDRSAAQFKKTVNSLAWGSFAWFAAEPDHLVELIDGNKGPVRKLKS
ncbi:MAG TPA: BsuBI/PstI family type II restriction endonuclease [Bradyrhizobium sp.]|nr:BsuBI/PstI family type II restriction endonuclease [Bradyrhizobium sp.]